MGWDAVTAGRDSARTRQLPPINASFPMPLEAPPIETTDEAFNPPLIYTEAMGMLDPQRQPGSIPGIETSEDIESSDGIKVPVEYRGTESLDRFPFVESRSEKRAASPEIREPVLALPSDSGYCSLGTDNASVCSVDSVENSSGRPRNFLQEFIAFFGDTLIENSGARQWISYALAHRTQGYIDNHIQDLLKEYTIALVRDRAGTLARGDSYVWAVHVLEKAASLICRYRPNITRYFRANVGTSSVNAASLTERLHALGRQLSLPERLALLMKSSATGRNIRDYEIGEDDIEEQLSKDLEVVKDMMISSEAFSSLASKLRQRLYHDERSEMQKISVRLKELSLRHAVFDVHWDPVNFMRTQYGADINCIPAIGSVVVITGSALYAQATTCAEYMESVWPKTVFQYLDMHVVLAINTDGIIEVSTIRGGGMDPVIELAEQLAWLGSALSTSPFGVNMAYARPVFCESGSAKVVMQFRFEPIHSTEMACWLPLFSGAVIASGFPISARKGEIGLDIPLEMLAGIAGVRHAVEYEGGVVMKGFSHMLVPIRKTDDRIQWHAVSSQDPSKRLSYCEGLALCGERALLKEVNLDDLTRCRAIVGWCTVAKSLLGSSSVNYENINYSGAEDASASLRCAGGSLGFQQFGTAALDFRFGVKDGKCHFQRSGPYRNIVSAAEKTPVVLYDTGEKRAWLVPASNVMLHMVQHRHYLEPFEIDGKPVSLDTNIDVDSTAKRVLMSNESLHLSNDSYYAFKDVVLNIWSLLEFLIDQNINRDKSTSGIPVKAPFREFLHGYEFKSVVEERSPFRQKQIQLSKTTGGWPLLVRDIDALVLFVDGLEDIIQPTKEGNPDLCHAWRRVPKGKDYLAASTQSIQDLHDVAGCRFNRKYLTSTRLKWHQGDSVLFTGCEKPESNRCNCDRLQQIHENSAIGTTIPPGSIAEKGAVIFGKSESPKNSFFRKRKRSITETGGFSSQNKLPIIVTRTQQQLEDESLSDVETCFPSGSDRTIDSLQSSHTSYTTESDRGISPSVEVSTGNTLDMRPKKRPWFPELSSRLPYRESTILKTYTSSSKRTRGV
ncbi:hypothetical protein DM02DRAFT_676776 [Periconia macrospinosa]|uniref:Pfs domain protein n=1 Tax=Periconia macrospinosa TaxID=97972 RepID=A0A2V1D8P7_9PLEO|nr:hypothetical protein DM02DRAFT_676776 [Periconia macrospinosa]